VRDGERLARRRCRSPAPSRAAARDGAPARLPGVPETVEHPSVVRVVEAAARKGVTLDIHTFSESTHTAAEAAAAVGTDVERIVKSLVFVAGGADAEPRTYVCLIAGPDRVDVARLAIVVGEPDIRRATAREARDLTGFVIGGIPPLGHARQAKVVMDPALDRHEIVWAAAGLPNAVFPVPPATLRALANATVAPLAAERGPAPGGAAT
jgi:prolyl-tRNA editing enzyme YbaK/EbsC (Cys-tRNA(Pro) deacylase)